MLCECPAFSYALRYPFKCISLKNTKLWKKGFSIKTGISTIGTFTIKSQTNGFVTESLILNVQNTVYYK